MKQDSNLLKNTGLFPCAREKIINNFKTKMFSIKQFDKILTP